MLTTQLVRDRFGQYYKIHTNRERPAPDSLTSEWFRDDIQAAQFVQNLIVPSGYWNSITFNSCISNKLPQNRFELDKRIGQLLKRGKIQVYKIDIPSYADHPPEKRTVLDKQKNKHIFATATILLTTNPKEVLTFSSKKEVQEYLAELSPDKLHLQQITKELNLPKTQSDNKSGVLLDKLATSLASGEVIVIVDRYSSPPRPEESSNIAESVIDKKADLGPPPDEFKEINIELEDEFDQSLANHYSLFDGLQYTLKTDLGDEHKGTIENGIIQIPKAKMNSSFEIEITNMPTFLTH